MLTEGFSGASVQRVKLNCVSLNVNGYCEIRNVIKNDEQQSALPHSTYIQKCDQPYQEVTLSDLASEKQGCIPADIDAKVRNYLQVNSLSGG